MYLINCLLLILVSGLILTNMIVYIKLVIFDEQSYLKIYLKWIPALLLVLQSFYFACLNKIKRDYEQFRISVLSVLGFTTCMIGDIFLIFDQQEMLAIGMLFFIIAYFCFGRKIKKSYLVYDSCKSIITYIGISIIFCFEFTVLPFLLYYSDYNDSYHKWYFIVYIFIYTMIMMISLMINCIYFIQFPGLQEISSLVGVLMFVISDWIIIYRSLMDDNKWLDMLTMIYYWIGITFISYRCIKS